MQEAVESTESTGADHDEVGVDLVGDVENRRRRRPVVDEVALVGDAPLLERPLGIAQVATRRRLEGPRVAELLGQLRDQPLQLGM